MPDEKPDPFVELANRNLFNKHSYDWLEFLPQLRGRKAAEVYREMATNDSLIGAILFAIEMVLRRVEWEVEPFSEDQADIDRADFLYTCMDDMSMTWEDVIALALSMLPYGHAWLETVYKKRETADIEAPAEKRSKYPDGKIGWRKFVLVPQETIAEWEVDEHGGVSAIEQGGAYNVERTRIPIEKSLLFRTDTRTPRGKSVLRTVVEAWYYRKRIRQIEGIGIERDLAGLPVFVLAEDIITNPTRRAEYERIITNLRRNEQEGVVVPGVVSDSGKLEPVADLKLLSSNSSRQFDTNVIVQRYAREIAVALLQDIVLLGHEKVGTQALASEKRDLSDTALQTWLNDIAAIFNTHAVPRLFALNGESLANLPKLVPGELRPTDVNEFATAIRDLASGGFVFDNPEDEQEVRRRVGMPRLRPEDLANRDEPDMDEPATPTQPEVPEGNGAADMGEGEMAEAA